MKTVKPNGEAAASGGEDLTARLRDRALLYLRGMDIPPLFALELTLECLRRAEAAPEPLSVPLVMKELHALLRANKFHTGWVDRQGPPRNSMPPLNRCSMIAEPLENSLWPRRRRPAGSGRTARDE